MPALNTKQYVTCAEMVKQRLIDAGADRAEVYTTDGHPVVFGEKMIDASKPTVLVYGHYDVQPADPLDLWNSEPFEPVIRNGKIFARGSCDDKGQFYMHVKAFETLVQQAHSGIISNLSLKARKKSARQTWQSSWSPIRIC